MGKLLKRKDEIDLALHIESNYIFAGKEFTYEQLAKEYGVSVNLIEKIAAIRKWEEKLDKLHKIIQEQTFIYTIAANFPDLAYINDQISKTEEAVNKIESTVQAQLRNNDDLKPRDLESISRTIRCTYDLKMDILEQKQLLIEKAKARVSQLQDADNTKELSPQDIILKLQTYLETSASPSRE